MKIITAFLLVLCLLQCGCSRTPEDTAPQTQTNQTTPETEPSAPSQDSAPTDPSVTPPSPGTDSTTPSPEIGPEGLPTPAL